MGAQLVPNRTQLRVDDDKLLDVGYPYRHWMWSFMIGLSDSTVPFAKQVLNFVTRPLDDRESESGPEKTSVIDVFWMFCWNLSLTLIFSWMNSF